MSVAVLCGFLWVKSGSEEVGARRHTHSASCSSVCKTAVHSRVQAFDAFSFHLLFVLRLLTVPNRWAAKWAEKLRAGVSSCSASFLFLNTTLGFKLDFIPPNLSFLFPIPPSSCSSLLVQVDEQTGLLCSVVNSDKTSKLLRCNRLYDSSEWEMNAFYCFNIHKYGC